MPVPVTRASRGRSVAAQAGPLALLLALVSCNPAPSPPATGAPPPAAGDVITAADGTRIAVDTFVRSLEAPWSMAFAPDGRLFVSERPGRVRIVSGGQLVATPALTLSDVAAVGEGGLLGIALHPDFARNQHVFLVYTTRTSRGLVNRLVRYREAGGRLAEAAVLLDDIPANNIHDGARLRFGPDGLLYLTMGDAAMPSIAQDLASLNGKILRLTDDGRTPPDNPRASPVYSYGHRNPQGLDWHPQSGDLWATEHGEIGNDEINRIVAGRNYGWPVIQGADSRPDMETPVLFFSPSIAPSGTSFYTGEAIPAFRGNLFVATLRGQHLLRVRFDPADPRRVTATERLLDGRFGRLRDVVSGPDGALYVCTSNRDGRGSPTSDDDRILRLSAAR